MTECSLLLSFLGVMGRRRKKSTTESELGTLTFPRKVHGAWHGEDESGRKNTTQSEEEKIFLET